VDESLKQLQPRITISKGWSHEAKRSPEGLNHADVDQCPVLGQAWAIYMDRQYRDNASNFETGFNKYHHKLFFV
jgi:hypothetical protein